MVRRDTGPTHGVLYLPGKDVIVEAARGHGCRVNGELVQLRKGQASETVHTKLLHCCAKSHKARVHDFSCLIVNADWLEVL